MTIYQNEPCMAHLTMSYTVHVVVVGTFIVDSNKLHVGEGNSHRWIESGFLFAKADRPIHFFLILQLPHTPRTNGPPSNQNASAPHNFWWKQTPSEQALFDVSVDRVTTCFETTMIIRLWHRFPHSGRPPLSGRCILTKGVEQKYLDEIISLCIKWFEIHGGSYINTWETGKR